MEEPVDPENGNNNLNSSANGQPSIEHVQEFYYIKGIEEIESLQLLDLSPLATWKLSSFKQSHGLPQLRDDNPETYWQSDGSIDNNMEPQPDSECNHLNHPHSVMLQFSKKVSLERISIFTNYQLDESYTPLKIKIMAGGSNWDLTEVCVVTFDKPIGWSHIIFKGVRGDGLLKCFVVKIIILANHQDGKDSHIRALRCYGKKASSNIDASNPKIELEYPNFTNETEISGILLNNRSTDLYAAGRINSFEQAIDEEGGPKGQDLGHDNESIKILNYVSDAIGFNSGFESLELKSVSSIR